MPRSLVSLAAVLLLTPALWAQSAFLDAAAQHEYLGRIQLESVGDCAPFELYVQPPSNPEEGFLERSEENFAPWLARIAELLQDRYLEPAGLIGGATSVPVVVLASRGDYENYLRASGTRWTYGPGGGWDAALGAAVGYQDSYGDRRPVYRQRGPVLRDAVLGLLVGLCPEGSPAPGSEWFLGGLAEHLGYHFGRQPDCLPDPTPDPKALASLHELLRTRILRRGYWMDLGSLLAPKDSSDLKGLPAAWVQREFGQGMAVERGFPEAFQLRFRAQSRLWSTFLHVGEEGRHAPHLPALLALAVRGELNEAALLGVLEEPEAGPLVDRFHGYLDESFQAVLRMPPVARRRADPRRNKEMPAPRGEDASASEEALEIEIPFELSDIGIEASSILERVALALALARAGRIDDAAARLVSDTQDDGTPEGARLERARGRLVELCRVRSAWIDGLVQDKGALRLPVGGKIRGFQVASRDGDRLVFKRGRDGVDGWLLQDLTAEHLLLNLKRKWPKFGPAWGMAYAQLLAEDPAWESSARKAGEEGAALLADAETLGDLLRLGSCLRLTQWLGNQSLPEEVARVDYVMTRLVELRDTGRGMPFVESHAGVMRDYALALLQQRGRLEGSENLLQGSVEDLGNGKLRLRYDFSDPVQLQDFVHESEILRRRLRSDPLGIPEEDWGAQVQDGVLKAIGRGCLLHSVRFSGELRIRFRGGFFRNDPPAENFAWFLLGGHLDPDWGQLFAAVSGRGFALEHAGGSEIHVATPVQLFSIDELDSRWTEIDFDGDGTYSLSYDGRVEVQHEVDRGPDSGNVYLGYHTAYDVRVDELVIEGTPEPGALDDLRAERLQAALDAAGF